jgi:hypothetical protein
MPKKMKQSRRAIEMDFEPFVELALSLRELGRDAVKIYAAEVDAVIRTRSHDAHCIENLIDRMLGFCFDSDMLLLFKKLCRHYFRIDPAATASYVHLYRDMWDNEAGAGK